MGATPDRPDPWKAQGIYLRLSGERKKHLLAIAEELGHLDSPARALAAHIETAGAAMLSNSDIGPESVEMTDAALWEGGLDRLDRMAAALADLADRVAGSPFPSNAQRDAKPIEAWLSRSLAHAGARDGALVLAKARWVRTERSSTESGKVDMEFEIDLLSVDGEPVRTGSVDLVKLPVISASSPFATDERVRNEAIAMACRSSNSMAWEIAAYAMLGGDLGPLIVAETYSTRQ